MVIDRRKIQTIEPTKLRSERFTRRLLEKIVAPDNEENRDEALAELAERLLGEGALDLASAAASRIAGWPGDKASILARIGVHWARLDRMESAERCFGRARESAHGCESGWQEAEALLQVARGLVEVDLRDKARPLLETARHRAIEGEKSPSRQDSLDASSVLGEIAMELVLLGDERQGLETARAIRNRGKRAAWTSRVRRLLGGRDGGTGRRLPART